MKIPKYKLLLDKSQQKENEAKELRKQAQSLCPHTNPEYHSFCDDDFASNKTYTTWYECPICKLRSLSEKQHPIYIKMEKQYRIQRDKEFKKKYGNK
jgi:hypothetical protein